jgi:malonate decarboxylase delta subunit
METLHFEFSGGSPLPSPAPPVVAGVVGSGNLEVLMETENLAGACRIEVVPSTAGFDRIWRAILTDFFERHRPGGLKVSINDGGATPAVISLRLDQAISAMKTAAMQEAVAKAAEKGAE